MSTPDESARRDTDIAPAETGRFRVPLEDAARAILAAFNGVLSLRQWGTTAAVEIATTSDLIFTALMTELSRKR